MLIMCYKIKLKIKRGREGRRENGRMGSKFCVLLLIGSIISINTTCNP